MATCKNLFAQNPPQRGSAGGGSAGLLGGVRWGGSAGLLGGRVRQNKLDDIWVGGYN